MDSSLVLEYRFDEHGDDVVIRDTAGVIDPHHAKLESDGELYNKPIRTSGIINRGLSFDGHALLKVDDLEAQLNLETFTLMAWVRHHWADHPTPSEVRLEALEKADAYWMNIRGESEYKNLLRVGFQRFESGSGKHVRLDSNIPIEENVWTHVAATYDLEYLRIYINGNPNTELLCSDPPCSNNHPLIIGAKYAPKFMDEPEAFYQGTIDEVQIYSRGLDKEEIKAAFAHYTPSPMPPSGLHI